MRRRFVIRLLVGALVGLGAAGAVLASGVVVSIRNESGVELENVSLSFGQHHFVVGVLQAGEVTSKRFHRAGEGADFALRLHRGGVPLQAGANVYFGDLSLSTTVMFVILDGNRVAVRHNGKAVASVQLLTTSRP